MRAIGYLVGGGSMSLGVEAAGFEISGVWETPGYSKNAQSWDLNRPMLAHSVQEVRAGSRFLGGDDVDLIYGNPPCGGLSNTTGAQHTSPTNLVMQNWLGMVIKARPRAILMENAFQLATGAGAPIRDLLGSQLDDAGYKSTIWLIDSWELGTPQVRRRAFLAAVKEGSIVDVKWSVPYQLREENSYPKEVWAETRLIDADPSPSPFYDVAGTKITQHWWNKTGYQHNELLKEHGDRITLGKFLTPHELKMLEARAAAGIKSAKREIEKRMPLLWPEVPRAFSKPKQFKVIRRLRAEAPSFVVLSEFNLAHPTLNRLLTMREMARLMGYPDDWVFHVLHPRLVAQGVPVANARWAASRLMEALTAAHS